LRLRVGQQKVLLVGPNARAGLVALEGDTTWYDAVVLLGGAEVTPTTLAALRHRGAVLIAGRSVESEGMRTVALTETGATTITFGAPLEVTSYRSADGKK
jgi:hypothetical protein